MERRRSARPALLLAAAALSVAAGCSSSPAPAGDAPQVATLASTPPRPGASTESAPERPRERLDMTDADFEALMEPYRKCMLKHGVDDRGVRLEGQPKSDGPLAEVTMSSSEKKKYDTADADCRPKFYPLPPWEYDPANPEAKDFARDVVQCLKRKGVKYVEVSPDGGFAFGGKQNHAPSISKGLEFTPACEREAAAGR